MKHAIHLKEAELRNMIAETLKKALKETRLDKEDNYPRLGCEKSRPGDIPPGDDDIHYMGDINPDVWNELSRGDYGNESLNESIKNSIKQTIEEQINYEKGVRFINEGMEMPREIERVWVYKDNEDTFLVKGEDGYYYDVYPTYGDSYQVNTDSDDYVDEIARKVEQSFINHNISAIAWNYDGQLAIEIRDGNYKGEFNKPLEAWLGRNGFKLEHYDDMYNAYFYDYEGKTTEINPEKLQQKLSQYEDITDEIMPFLSGNSIRDGRNMHILYQRAKKGIIDL